MKRDLFNTKSITPQCGCCELARKAPDKETMLCPRKGVVAKAFSCRKFKYDPLKKEPRRAPALPVFDEDDFRL